MEGSQINNDQILAEVERCYQRIEGVETKLAQVIDLLGILGQGVSNMATTDQLKLATEYLQTAMSDELTAIQDQIANPAPVRLHFDASASGILDLVTVPLTGPATGTLLTITTTGEVDMPASLNVDQTGKATLSFTDDHGNTTSAPEGAVVTFTSDNEAVVSVVADATDPLAGDLTPVAPGTANITADVTGALEADGVTPFPPASAEVSVGPGPAVGDALTITVTPTGSV